VIDYTSWMLAALCSFALCFLLTPVLRNLAARRGLVDQPDLDRKRHQVAVPRIGGVPVVFACLVSVGVVVVSGRGNSALEEAFLFGLQVLPASIFILITGIVDDLVGLRPVQKLAGQSLAALFACLAGLRFHFWDGSLLGEVSGFALAFTWLVACSNAFNLIDGVDGLAAGLGFIAAATVLFVALSLGNVAVGVLAASMAGALLGFLFFNFNPASIFLGDSGSLWTGFMLGCFGLVWFERSTTVPATIAPVFALSVPLTDMTLSILRRFVSERPIFSADRGHIHHRLLERCFAPRRVTLGLYAVSLLASGLALALGLASEIVGYAIVVAACLAGWFAVRRLAYDEFRILCSLIRNIRPAVKSGMSLIEYEARFKNASSPEACWFVLLRAGHEFGFSGLSLQLGGRRFQERSADGGQDEWVLRIPLSHSDYVNLTRRRGSEPAAEAVSGLANLLLRCLSEKASVWRDASEGEPRKLVVHGDFYSV
jgi:UDP-GlcNAc:undecaprenyl-phosphate GlcNAc-1-phosphate transferase